MENGETGRRVLLMIDVQEPFISAYPKRAGVSPGPDGAREV